MSKSVWWILFLVDTVAMSGCFQGFKQFTLMPNVNTSLVFLASILFCVLCTFLLVYDSYVKESAQGKVKRQIRLFEWLMMKHVLVPSVVSDKPAQSQVQK